MRVKNDCVLMSDDRMHLPNAMLEVPAVSEQDSSLISDFAIKRGLDIVTASFCRSSEDVEEVRKILDEKEQGKKVQIYAKI